MHEKEKLKEAEYFFQHMQVSMNDPEAFRYKLSAFLSAARSVLQYAHDEARTNPKGQSWYKEQVNCGVVMFFKDKRDVNIHGEPVRPAEDVAKSVTETVRTSESVLAVLRKADGTVETRAVEADSTQQTAQESHDETTMIGYRFADWTGAGNGEVINLSRQYLAALHKFVEEGIGSGVTTG